MSETAIGVRIDWMIRRDYPDVLAIERASSAWPWSEEDFVSRLRQRNCIGMVATGDGRIVGFMVYELHRGSLVVLDIAVHPGFRRRGVGSRMVARLAGKLSDHRRPRIVLSLRETNLAAQLFFRSRGFLAVQTIRQGYRDTHEDEYVMEYRLTDSTVGSAKYRDCEGC